MSQFMTVLIFEERESERVNRLVIEILVPVKKELSRIGH